MPAAAIEERAGEAWGPAPWLHTWLRRATCLAFGHAVDNRRFAAARDLPRLCPCGRTILRRDGSETRVRHTLACFFRHHTYVRTGERDGHQEYVCTRCGHPLLFLTGAAPYARLVRFPKRVRYLCNLFGHRVHHVASRQGLHEYACACGHSFLRPRPDLERVTHPPVCTVAGHFLRFTESRQGYAEHVCRNCGHTFSFV